MWTDAGRTSRALVTLPGDQAPLEVSLPAVLEALGLGSVPWGDRATGLLGGPDASGTRAALSRLYRDACGRSVRLDVHAPGHPSQLQARADRHPVDLAAGATSAIDLGVQVATWLRDQRGTTAPRAVVCRDDVPADCLAGAGLLTGGGPLLYVPGGPDGHLPEDVRAVLARSVALGGEIDVLGGPQAVSPQVVDELQAGVRGRTVVRLAGADRYATAATIARAVAPSGAERVLLARGDNPADATAAAALASRDGLPVLLTASDRLSGPAAEWLREVGAGRAVLLEDPPRSPHESAEPSARSPGTSGSLVRPARPRPSRSPGPASCGVARSPRTAPRSSVSPAMATTPGRSPWRPPPWPRTSTRR